MTKIKKQAVETLAQRLSELNAVYEEYSLIQAMIVIDCK